MCLSAVAPSPINVAPLSGAPIVPFLTRYASVHEKTNLPFGLQIITYKYNDFSLLELSKKISKLLK